MTHSVLLNLINSRSPQITSRAYYQQARKQYANIYRASYQAGYLWRQSVEKLDIPDPEQWVWKKDCKGDFQPLRTTSQT